MKKNFLLPILCLYFSQILLAEQDIKLQIFNDNFLRLSTKEIKKIAGYCYPIYSYEGCDKIYTKEIVKSIKECDMGNGKYSSCQKILEISDEYCFKNNEIGNFVVCSLTGRILAATYKIPDGLKRLTRACDMGKIAEACLFSAITYQKYFLDIDEVIKYATKTRDLAHNKEFFDKVLEKFEKCKIDKECNPAKIEFSSR
jgi:hypothetical protein|nr:hypothetical protein [uncultured Campylobacter sp.]